MYFTEEPPLISPELQLLSGHSCEESSGGCRTWSDHQRAPSHTVCQEPAEKHSAESICMYSLESSLLCPHTLIEQHRSEEVHLLHEVQLIRSDTSHECFHFQRLDFAPFQRRILPSSAASVRYFSLQHFIPLSEMYEYCSVFLSALVGWNSLLPASLLPSISQEIQPQD